MNTTPPAIHAQPNLGSQSTVPSRLRLAKLLFVEADRYLLLVGVVMLAMAPVCAALSLVDHRVLDGANVWHKPVKFQMSVGVFLLTLAIMVAAAGTHFRHSIVGRITVWTAISTTIFEIAWITFRAATAQRSHYATDTAVGTNMYILMGIAAVLLSLTPTVASVAAMAKSANPRFPKILKLSMLLGSFVALVGAAVVGSMLSEDPAHYPTDAADKGARIPFVGWSVQRDDLRIAHFVGLHALQGLMALGLCMSSMTYRKARTLMNLAALAWLAVVVALILLASEQMSPFMWLS